eukprot:2121007-Pyramimonas_sp.AAC.1
MHPAFEIKPATAEVDGTGPSQSVDYTHMFVPCVGPSAFTRTSTASNSITNSGPVRAPTESAHTIGVRVKGPRVLSRAASRGESGNLQ